MVIWECLDANDPKSSLYSYFLQNCRWKSFKQQNKSKSRSEVRPVRFLELAARTESPVRHFESPEGKTLGTRLTSFQKAKKNGGGGGGR